MTKTIEQEALDLNALAAKAWEDGQMAFDAATSPLTNPFPCRGQGDAAATAAIAAVIAPELERRDREIERLRDGLAGAIAAISDPRGLDDAICCSGHMCGCRGSSHRELLLHDLSEVLARTALGASHDADA